MIEKRPALTLLSHLVLILGVAIVAFPLYLTLIASTQTAQQCIHDTTTLGLCSSCSRSRRFSNTACSSCTFE